MHEKLISANIALYRGERAETLRLIDELQRENPAEIQSHLSMVLWLSAHAQTDNSLRLQGMHELIAIIPADDYYCQMTRQYLSEEDVYSTRLQPQRGIQARGLIGVLALVIVLAILAIGVFNQGEPLASIVDNPTPSLAPTIDPAKLPDKSRAIVADSFTARYEEGIIQVTAIEDRSERIVFINDGSLTKAVAGARFYALNITFECRQGICNNPPQAKLSVQLTNESELPARDDVTIAGQSPFQAIALGRTSSAWVVFELPTLNNPTKLIIRPESNQDEPTQLYEIALPAS